MRFQTGSDLIVKRFNLLKTFGFGTASAAGSLALLFAATLPGEAGVPLPKPHPGKAARALAERIMATPPRHQNAPPLPRQAPTRAAPPPAPMPLNPAPLAAPRTKAPTYARLAIAATSATSQADLDVLARMIKALKRQASEASALAETLQDPLARKLAEWLILRADDNGAPAERYLAFLAANRSWPSQAFMHRRIEASFYDDKRAPRVVLDYFAHRHPETAKGYLAQARALLAIGDRTGATRQVRLAWRTERMWASLENAVLDEFGALLTAGDHKARMDLLLSHEDREGGMRNAKRVGGATLAIANARIAVIRRAKNARALLDAVPQAARTDPGFMFSLAQYYRRNDKSEQAARVLLAAPSDPALLVNRNEWWIERRVLVRQLLDAGDPAMAYRIARGAAAPEKRTYRTDKEFTAGWIALRYLRDPKTALAHFSIIDDHTDNPTALARAGYWQGRALEAMGRRSDAQKAYAFGAQYSTAYYGQLARARLNLSSLELKTPPTGAAARGDNYEIVRALELLYALDASDLAIPLLIEVGEYGSTDAIAALADIAKRNNDARGLLLLAKDAINRGLPFDFHAYPTFGLPKVRQIGPDIDPAVVYAIARQESGFNPRVVSPAKAMGLMQVTPVAARYISRKFNVPYDVKRLLSDQVYNVQLGSAELADLIKDYNGSYIMAFAGYNAGRGRVRQWVERYGDPRDPRVDAIDWIERIPFSETRNYVQRILENMQVYRARLSGRQTLRIEADLNGGRGAQ